MFVVVVERLDDVGVPVEERARPGGGAVEHADVLLHAAGEHGAGQLDVALPAATLSILTGLAPLQHSLESINLVRPLPDAEELVHVGEVLVEVLLLPEVLHVVVVVIEKDAEFPLFLLQWQQRLLQSRCVSVIGSTKSNLFSFFTARLHENFLGRGLVCDEGILLRPVHQSEGDHIVHRWVDELLLLVARFLGAQNVK